MIIIGSGGNWGGRLTWKNRLKSWGVEILKIYSVSIEAAAGEIKTFKAYALCDV